MDLSPAERAAVLADDRLLDDVRTGLAGPEDPDPLVRLLVRWRAALRRPRARRSGTGLRCVGKAV